MMSFGVSPTAGAGDARYSKPLMLRWIALSTSPCIRCATPCSAACATAMDAPSYQSADRSGPIGGSDPITSGRLSVSGRLDEAPAGRPLRLALGHRQLHLFNPLFDRMKSLDNRADVGFCR